MGSPSVHPSRGAAPSVVVLAGPNGAGKSTAAPGHAGVHEFVNADTIARGLFAFGDKLEILRKYRLRRAEVDRRRRRGHDHYVDRRGVLASRYVEIHPISADPSPRPDIKRVVIDGVEIDRAVRAALRDHKRAGNPICDWRDGKLVWIAPEDIPDFPDEGDEPSPVEPPFGS